MPHSWYRRPEPELETQERTCEKHGHYISKNLQFRRLSENEWMDNWTGCPNCEDERARARQVEYEKRERECELQQRIEYSEIPVRYRRKAFADFIVASEKQRAVVDIARHYVETFQQQRDNGRCLIFCGNVGTGKTLLACIIAGTLLVEHDVRYLTVSGLIQLLRSTWRRHSEQSELSVLCSLEKLDLLVLDEVGVQFGSEVERVQLFDVLDRRYRAVRPTIVIGNLDLAGVKTHLGERLVDRLRENDGRVLVFDWRSHRGNCEPREAAPASEM